MSNAYSGLLTPQEYLELDRKAENCNGFYRGEMFPMSRGNARDCLIKTNLIAELRSGLRDKPPILYSGLRVKVPESGLYTYPHAFVVIGEPQFDDEFRDTILNPIFIAEVLLHKAEGLGHGRSWYSYRPLASMQEYLMVTQNEPELTLYSRYSQPPRDGWTIRSARGLDRQLSIPSLGISLSLAEVYDKVDFSPEYDIRPESSHDPH